MCIRDSLGIAQAHLGDYGGAETSFDEALRRDPGFAAAAANLVETALQAGDLERARAAADRFVAIAPSSLRARYSRGLVALRQNDLSAARTDFAALVAAAAGVFVPGYGSATVVTPGAPVSITQSFAYTNYGGGDFRCV